MAAANYFFFVVPPFGFFPVGFAGEPLGGAVPAAMPLLTVPAFKSTVKLSPEPVFPVAGSWRKMLGSSGSVCILYTIW